MSKEKISTTMITTPTRRQVIAGVAFAFGGLALGSSEGWAEAEGEISHTAESIHQEPVFKANRKHVYEALTDAQQFNKVAQIIAAKEPSISLEKAPTQISREAGGAFLLFGGIIMGRHIELVPNERIVQAWRVSTGNPGFTRLRNSNSRSKVTGPKSFLITPAFPRAGRTPGGGMESPLLGAARAIPGLSGDET